jgi:hypothetical protein
MVRALRWERGKDPNETIDYSVDWSNDLGSTDAISTSTWTFDAANVDTALTKSSPSIDSTLKVTTIWFAAGTEAVTYKITNQIVTTGGRTIERSITLLVSSR